MICENCGKEHDGSYKSKRFCSRYCLKVYPTKSKRDEINKKVSNKLKGKFLFNKNDFSLIHQKSVETKKINFQKKTKETEWNNLSQSSKRRILLEEQQNCCKICKINLWNNKPIKLHLDHIDGNRYNEIKANLRLVCPNCHSQTETYCGKNQNKNITDDIIEKELIDNNFNIVQTIKSLGISYGGNYYKCKRVLDKLTK